MLKMGICSSNNERSVSLLYHLVEVKKLKYLYDRLPNKDQLDKIWDEFPFVTNHCSHDNNIIKRTASFHRSEISIRQHIHLQNLHENDVIGITDEQLQYVRYNISALIDTLL